MKTHAGKNPFSIRPIRKRKLSEKIRKYRHALYAVALLAVGGTMTLGLQGAFAGDVSTTFSDPAGVTAAVDTIEYGTPNLPGASPQGALVKPSFSDTNLRGYVFNQAADGETPEVNPLQLYDYTNVWGRMNVISGLWNTGGKVTPPPGGASSVAADNPVGSVFPGAASREILKFNITAANGDLTITSMSVANTGTSQPSDFAANSVKLYKDGVLIGTSSFSSPAVFSGLTATVGNGTTAAFSVKADIAADAVAGRTILANATMTARSGTRNVSIPGTNNTSELTIAAVPLIVTAASGTPTSSIFSAATADRPVAIFKVGTDANAARSVTINSVAVTKTGTAKNSEIVNFKLYECPTGAALSCTTQLGSTAAALSPSTGTSDATATFSGLNFTVGAGTTTYLGVKISTAATITGGQFRINIQRGSDVTTAPASSTTVDGAALPLQSNLFTVGPRLTASGYVGSAINRYTGSKKAIVGQFIYNTAGGTTTISPALILTHRGTAHAALKNIEVYNTAISSTTPIATAATLVQSSGVYFAKLDTFSVSPWNITSTMTISYNILVKADLACGTGVGQYVQFELDPAGIRVNGGKTGLTASGGRYNIISAPCTAESAASIPASTFDGSILAPGTASELYFGYNGAGEAANIAASIQGGSGENMGNLLQANLLSDMFSIQRAEAAVPPSPSFTSPVIVYDGLSIQGNSRETGAPAGNLDVQGKITNNIAGSGLSIQDNDGINLSGSVSISNGTLTVGGAVINSSGAGIIVDSLKATGSIQSTGSITNQPGGVTLYPAVFVDDNLDLTGSILTPGDNPVTIDDNLAVRDSLRIGPNGWLHDGLNDDWIRAADPATGAYTHGLAGLKLWASTDAYIEGTISNSGAEPLAVADNMTVTGHISAAGGIGSYYQRSASVNSDGDANGYKEIVATCDAASHILVSCSGYLNGNTEKFKGAQPVAGPGCRAAATATAGNSDSVTAYAICFNPNG